MADNFWPIAINPMALGADESTLPGGAGWENANLLPIQKNRKTGQWAWGMPNSLAAALSGIMAPGKAANGLYERMIDPTTGVNYYDGMLGDVSNLAGMLTLGGSAIPKPIGALGMGGGAKLTLSEIEKMAKQAGVDLYVSERPESLQISKIVVPKEKRGAGLGSRIMQEIVAYADASEKPITLTPSKDFGASSIGALERFYKRFGFEKNTGKRADHRFRDTMLRGPK